MTITDALDRSLRGHDVETAATSDRDLPDIDALFLSIQDNSPHEIAGAKTFDRPRCFGGRPWEAVLVHPAHLPRVVTDCLDAQRSDICRIEFPGCAETDTSRVYPMGFRQASAGSVELRQSA